MNIFEAITAALNQSGQQGQQQPPVQRQSAPQPQANQAGSGPAIPTSLQDILNQAGFGNLTVIVDKLSKGGLEEHVKSWLGQGENLPVETAPEVKGHKREKDGEIPEAFVQRPRVNRGATVAQR
jgi:uncharacterized protein YidB (DUF937 family)